MNDKFKIRSWYQIVYLFIFLALLFSGLFLFSFKFTKKIVANLFCLEEFCLLNVNKNANNYLKSQKTIVISEKDWNVSYKLTQSNVIYNNKKYEILCKFLKQESNDYWYWVYTIKDLNFQDLQVYSKVYFAVDNLNFFNFLK